MTVIERSALVPHRPADMFALVNDVERYPEFLPWCIGASVTPLAVDEVQATLQVKRGPFRSAFTTQNRLRVGEQIHMQLHDGPFRHLAGIWRFEPVGERGARVSFHVDFEFKNALTATAFGSLFQDMCGTMVDAFVARARQVYGAGH